jgi:hypothetical protein
MAVVEEERAAQQAKNGFPPARPRIAPSTWDADVVFVRDRVRRGLAEEAQETIERLMERVGGVTPVEVGLAYAEYLLGRGRPFAAGRALWPLVQREGGDPRARVRAIWTRRWRWWSRPPTRGAPGPLRRRRPSTGCTG